MSLINLQTGATAAEEMRSEQSEKIISDLQTRIYKQDLLIKKLNEEANRLHSQNENSESLRKEIELLRSKLNESESVRKELGETVTRAENKIQDLQQELDRKNKNPLQVKYEYLSRCYNCKIDEYEKISLDAEKSKQQAEKIREEAENQRKYFYNLVNNYNTEIDKRVDKIVKRKTAFQRFADWFSNFISAINSAAFFVPFLYAVGITILAICRNKIVRDDFIIAGKAVGKAFVIMFDGVKWLILKAAGLSGFIDDPTVEKILWWVILILMILIIIAIILFLLFLISFFVYIFYDVLKDKLSVIFNKTYLAVMLTDLGIITFCGDLIKAKIEINLVLTYFIFLAVFTALKIVVPIIIKKIRR